MKNQEYVQTEEALRSVVDYFGTQKSIALDTEFHRERSYFPQIALLQISDGERTCCIDPLAIADLSPLGDLLTSPQVIKVIHSASQDLEVFANTLKLMPVSLFDTQIGAAFLGLGEQVSYAALVKHYCNRDLDKAHTRSNWLQRPLSDEQLNYAAEDVFYLAKIYPLMLEELQRAGRLEWMLQECAGRTQLQDYQPKPDQCWKKVKGKDRLKGPSTAALKTLAFWREEIAVQKDRPRRFMMTDEILVEIARMMPKTLNEMAAIPGLETALLSTQTRTLLAAVDEAREMPEALWPVLKDYQKKTAEEKNLLDALTKLVQHFAEASGITPSLIATRSDLESVLRGETSSPLLQDWRGFMVGEFLSQFVQGEWGAAILRGAPVADVMHQFLLSKGELA